MRVSLLLRARKRCFLVKKHPPIGGYFLVENHIYLPRTRSNYATFLTFFYNFLRFFFQKFFRVCQKTESDQTDRKSMVQVASISNLPVQLESLISLWLEGTFFGFFGFPGVRNWSLTFFYFFLRFFEFSWNPENRVLDRCGPRETARNVSEGCWDFLEVVSGVHQTLEDVTAVVKTFWQMSRGVTQVVIVDTELSPESTSVIRSFSETRKKFLSGMIRVEKNFTEPWWPRLGIADPEKFLLHQWWSDHRHKNNFLQT